MMKEQQGNGFPEIQVQQVNVWFEKGQTPLQAVDNVSFNVPANSFLTVLGPNGCGKSTLLHVIAGLIPPTSGQVLHGGKRVVRPDGSRLLMFQERTLFPWLNITQNMSFGLRAKGIGRSQREKLIPQYLELVGLRGFENAYPHELSGGMRQRAELARALVVKPRVLLLDEPFAALDALTREILQEELLRLHRETKITFIMVTHDIQEATFLSDYVLLMSRRPGRLKDVLEIESDKPRRPSWRGDPHFASLCYQILSSLREELEENPVR